MATDLINGVYHVSYKANGGGGGGSAITDAEATIDANVGTPSVDVELNDTTLSFAFHNLKGTPGETGATGPVGPVGPQGNTGSSVEYPYELINNLTTDDATKGLSAAQGVALKSELSQLDQKVDDIDDVETENLWAITNEGSFINASGEWASSSNFNSCQLMMMPGRKYRVVQQTTTGAGNYVRIFQYEDGTYTQVYAEQTSGVDVNYTCPNDGKTYILQAIWDLRSGVVGNTEIYCSIGGINGEVAELSELSIDKDYFNATMEGAYYGDDGTIVESANFNSCQLKMIPGATYRIVQQESIWGGNFVRIFKSVGNTLVLFFAQKTQGGEIKLTIPNDGNTYILQAIMDLRSDAVGKTEIYVTMPASDWIVYLLGQTQELVQKVSYKKGTDLPVNATSANWKLTGTGLSASDSTAQLRKFQVVPGSMLYLKLSADTPGVYQFQKSASVPGSGTNSNLVGTPVTTAVDGYVEVPATATYLIISELKTNTTNVVASTTPLNLADIGASEVLSGTAVSGKIISSGIWQSDSSFQVVKYAVSEGQLLHLKLSKDADVVYQWQNNVSIPSTAPNSYLVGIPVLEAIDGYVFVPSGVTYLMVVESTSNTTNEVRATDKNADIVALLNRVVNDTKVVHEDDVVVLNTSVNGSKRGVFVNSSLGLSSSEWWSMSDPFLVRKGQKVSITATDTGTSTYLLVGVDSSVPITATTDERKFTVITEPSPGNTNTVVTREWIATEDMYVIAQYNSLTSLLLGSPAVVPELSQIWGKLHDLQEKVGTELPDYVKAEIERVYGVLVNRSLGDVHIAAFSSDQHFDLDRIGIPGSSYNPKWVMQGVEAMKEIANRIPVDEVIIGGDIAGYGGGTSADAEGILETVNYLFQDLVGIDSMLIGIPGNHDAYQNSGDVTAQGMYNVFAKRNQRHTYYHGNGADNCDAYVDDAEHRIRSIFVDTYSQNVRTEDFRDFLASALSSLPEDYKALVFSHNALTNEFAGTVLAQKISDPSVEIDAFQNPTDCHAILNEYADKIIACICGHSHFDASAISEAGILYIETTTAAPHTRNYTTDDIPNSSTLGTVTDTSFDFFVIDQAAQTIEAVRYGEGCNRKWTYKGAGAGMMEGYPETIVRS